MQATPIAPQADPAPRSVVYEQPLNERLRTFLRLEFLYQQALYHAETAHSLSSRAAVASLLEILAITARGDTRSDVLKELERQLGMLKDYQVRAGVDTGRLKAVMSTLGSRRDELSAAAGSAYARLRDNEFLNAIKLRSGIPGGTCEFDLPDFCHWLNMPLETRQADFHGWLATLKPLCEAVVDLLWVARESTRARREVASGGVFQLSFERESPIQLLRIMLPADAALYPEISGSHHRCSIRFLSCAQVGQRPLQAEEDVAFVLACCS